MTSNKKTTTTIIYRASDNTMGDGMTPDDCQAYRSWAKRELLAFYPDAEVEVVNEQGCDTVIVEDCPACHGSGVHHPDPSGEPVLGRDCQTCDGRDTVGGEFEQAVRDHLDNLWDWCDWSEVAAVSSNE